ncbi:MAG: DUF1579 family protein [Planctomycetota bacterium]|nr:DUF1579 family protein [Planctomycetota bacterium]
MFAARIAAISAATLLTGAAIAAITSVNPFQAPSLKVDQHEIVTQSVGEWTGTITMNVPGMEEPMVMPCTESITAIGDLWTVSRFESNFGGTSFTGSATLGYDVEKKAFVSTWIDSMTTTITNMEGQYDKESNSLTSTYQGKNQMTGMMEDRFSVCTWGTDNYICKFYTKSDEGDVLGMTIDMQRKKTVEASAEIEEETAVEVK